MAEPKRYYLIKQGEHIQGRDKLFEAIDNLQDGRYFLDIKKQVKKRTNSQNSLLHLYLQIIADDTGNSLETVKSCLKTMFLTTTMKDNIGNDMYNPKTGEQITYVRNTSDPDFLTTDMMLFIDNIFVFAADFGIILPLPGESMEMKL
jgi:hypothetical protein